MTRMNVMTISILTVGLMMGNTAFAGDLCKSVDIRISNQTGYTAKVTKVEYYDYDTNQWRSEALTQQILQDNVLWTWNRNLEHIDNDLTKLRVSYKEKYGGAFGGWSNTFSKTSGQFTCRDNGTSPTVSLN